MSKRAGIILKSGDELAFVDEAFAIRIAVVTATTAVPGLPSLAGGVGLIDGEVALLLSPWKDVPARAEAQVLLSSVRGQSVALLFEKAVSAGLFDASLDNQGVRWGDLTVPELSLPKLYDRIESEIWDNNVRAYQGEARHGENSTAMD